MQIIYVTSPDSQEIYVWKLNVQYRKLNLIQIVSTPGQGQPIVVHPTKKFLYVGIRPNFKIITYSIDQSGFLKNVGSIDILSSPTYLTINEEGTFLYCASYQYNVVSIYSINTSGIIDKTVQIIDNLLGCHFVGIDKYKKLLWISCLKENSIRLFNLNMSGILIQLNSIFIKNDDIVGPRHIAFHNTDYYAYVINELNGTINVINYDYSSKIPRIVQTLDIIPKDIMCITQYWSADIHISPNGNWLYCSDRAMSIISSFKISHNNRQLKFVGYQFTETQPRGFSIDSTGQFLIVAGQKSHYISLYYINSDNGKLIILSRYYSGKGPIWVNIITLN